MATPCILISYSPCFSGIWIIKGVFLMHILFKLEHILYKIEKVLEHSYFIVILCLKFHHALYIRFKHHCSIFKESY